MKIDRGWIGKKWRHHPVRFGARPEVVAHHLTPARWALPDLRIAVLSDLHICEPWTGLRALTRIVAQVNALSPDLIVLGGDFLASGRMAARRTSAEKIVEALLPLRAPLGVAAVLGNHDWWDCKLAHETNQAQNSVRAAMADTQINLLENAAVPVDHGSGFWLVGLDSQEPSRSKQPGRHCATTGFADVPEGAPTILLAHEPDYFAEGDTRALLQISGHTHGGQANLGGWRPITPSAYGSRYAWGHVHEQGRDLIISGGIGYSGLPLRLFQPPEITLVTLSAGG